MKERGPLVGVLMFAAGCLKAEFSLFQSWEEFEFFSFLNNIRWMI